MAMVALAEQLTYDSVASRSDGSPAVQAIEPGVEREAVSPTSGAEPDHERQEHGARDGRPESESQNREQEEGPLVREGEDDDRPEAVIPKPAELVARKTQTLRWLTSGTAASLILLGLAWSGIRYLFMILGGCFFRFKATDYDLWKRNGDVCQENIWVSVVLGVIGSIDFNAQLLIGLCAFLSNQILWVLIVAASVLNVFVRFVHLCVIIGLGWYVRYYVVPYAVFLFLLCLQSALCIFTLTRVRHAAAEAEAEVASMLTSTPMSESRRNGEDQA